jgi:diaminohydroxyphosphoribosylaminopyrimidine deaminase/5-amino-6-(5-phosphoribosylamino)uracil reductase
MAAPEELAAMRRAIALSAGGLGTTSPNPPVGCVVLDARGRIAGEGYHERKGEAHAEVQALAAAGTGAEGGTAVVTLEPCNHHGRTPPCRQALIDARVSRVVIAVIDPTSRGEGGAAALRAAGITVETDVLHDEALAVLGPWLTALRTHRPEITWPYLITSGGIEALPGGTPEAQFLRRNADAVLLADGTVTEAIPDAHGAGILKLADIPPGTDPLTAAGSLYEGGVRRLLLLGGHNVAAPFIAVGILDRVLAYTPEGSASRRPAAIPPWPEIPPGFEIIAAATIDGLVRIEAWREQAP